MTNYRDELIQTIKDMGQELIDRAESMVHEDCDMITNFNINIDISQPMDGHPELTWSTSVINKTFYDRMGRTAGDMKLEVHAETTTVEKKPVGTVYICVHHDTQNMEAIFDNRPDAEECLHQMDRICTWYGVVTEADLYDLCAITCVSGATDRGWVTTEAMSVVQEKDDYILKLPKPLPLHLK